MPSVLLTMMSIDTAVEIKHAMFELCCCVSLDLFALFSCIRKETVLSVAAFIQGRIVLLSIHVVLIREQLLFKKIR